MSINLSSSTRSNILIYFSVLLTFTNFIKADTTRPIIGILTQELEPKLKEHYPYNNSYIAASYVKFVEGAGARVVPIRIGQSDDYYDDILSKINGVLWPGGASSFYQKNGYADAGYKIYKIAERMNENGDYFPIIGICLGFELMTYVAANRTNHRINCNSHNQALSLNFTKDFKKSRLFKNASNDVINILSGKKVTINFHSYCITDKNLKLMKLNKKFRVTSHNYDSNELWFISSLEHVQAPFYGIQFHPEKNIYEWIIGKNIPHRYEAIEASQYFANFFVNECRKNSHRFSDTNEELNSLIYNYSPVYTALKGSAYEQCYFF